MHHNLWELRTVGFCQPQGVAGVGCAMHLSIFVGMGSFVTLCNVLGLSIVFWRLVLVEALIHGGGGGSNIWENCFHNSDSRASSSSLKGK